MCPAINREAAGNPLFRRKWLPFTPPLTAGNKQGAEWCVAKGLDWGYKYVARVAGVGKGGGKYYGVSLQVTFWDGSLAAQPPEDPPLPPIEPANYAGPRESSVAVQKSGCLTLLCLVGVLVTAVLIRR